MERSNKPLVVFYPGKVKRPSSEALKDLKSGVEQ